MCVYVCLYAYSLYIHTYISFQLLKRHCPLVFLDNTHEIRSFWLFFPFSDSEVNPVTLQLEETPRLTRTRFSMRTRHQRSQWGWEIVQSVMCLLCQPEAPSSDPQYPEKSGIVACISTPGKWW